MPFSARLYETPEEDVRAHRHRTHIEATAAPTQELTHYVVVHNLSTDGILVESHDTLHRNAVVVFDIPGLGRLPARVAWHGDIFYGCAFLKPLEQRAIDAKLASSKVVWADFAGRATPANADPRPATLFPMQRDRAAPSPQWQDLPTQVVAPMIPVPQGRWPIGARFAFIIGSAATLWAIIGAIMFLIVR